MKKIISKIWNDPVGSKVISAVILAIFGAGLINFWEMFQEGLSLIGSMLAYKIGIPVWLLIIFVVAIVALILTTLIIQKSEPEEIEIEHDFLKYKTDNILGIIWRWDWLKDYSTGKYKITDLHPRCPKCKSHAIGNNDELYSNPDKVVWCIKDGCGWIWQQSSQYKIGLLSNLETKVKIEMDRKIHSGEFQDVGNKKTKKGES